MIRQMTAADAEWAAQKHAELMADSVFALFGTDFLCGLYRALAESKFGVAFVFEENSAPAAVITATTNRSRLLLEWLKREKFKPLLRAATRLFTDHRCRRLILQTPRYLRRAAGTGCSAELIFITVSPAARGKGTAHELIRAVLEEMRRRGIPRVCVSIESANRAINSILTDMGFHIADTLVFAGKRNYLLMRELKESP